MRLVNKEDGGRGGALYGFDLSVAKKASLNNGRIFAAHPERTLELSEWFKSNCIGLKASASAPDATAAPTPSNINWG